MRDIARPSPKQLEWADCEVGVIIHLDLQVFEPSYRFRKQWGYHPPASIFNPKALNTDQWIEVAKEMGAKYAVLVVKHCSGICLWPSKASDYNIKNNPYKNGEGDVFREFITSCKKFGIRPGVYYSTICNAHELYDQPKKASLI
jgi:alpha-L-fucosidase